MMATVFIGGSRGVLSLPAAVALRIDGLIAKDFLVLVGDANGADKAVQSYLSKHEYRNVEVFCSGPSPRNNLGGWPLRCIPANRARGSLVEFYMAKDRAMTDEATAGLMVWNGGSAGTLANVFRLLGQEKPVAVYAMAEKQFHDLQSLGQWDEFIARCAVPLRREVERRASRGQCGPG
jgi:hypothetical protein